jgi:hypothetical protein
MTKRDDRRREPAVDELDRRRPAVVRTAGGAADQRGELRRLLATRGTLRRLMLLREVLGPPKALE